MRVLTRFPAALSIAAGQLPANNAAPRFCDEDPDDAGANGKGFVNNGEKADFAVLLFKASAWGAVTKAELVVQRSYSDGTLDWFRHDPPVDLQQIAEAAKFLELSSGQVNILAALATDGLAILVPLYGATRFRFGFRAGAADDPAAFAAVVGLELVGTGE